MRLGELLRFTVRIFAFVINTIVLSLCMELNFLFGSSRRIDKIHRWTSLWARNNMRIFGVRVFCEGLPKSKNGLYPGCDENGIGRIFVMNHRSGMDILAIISLAEAHIISRHDLASWPFLGFLARRVETLFVDRSSKRSGASVLKQVAEKLEAGEGVAMFPEGTAHTGDEVHDLRTGAFNSARRAGAEIVPLGIAYSDKAAYYGELSFLAHLKQVTSLKKLDIAVEIGKPISMADQSSVEMKEIVRDKMQQLVDQARAKLELHQTD